MYIIIIQVTLEHNKQFQTGKIVKNSFGAGSRFKFMQTRQVTHKDTGYE